MSATTPATATGSATVLVVEDEPSIRDLICAAIAEVGHETAPVDSYEAAVAAIHPGTRLVVSDIDLSGRSGLDLLAELRRNRPEIRVMLVSAHGTDLERGRDEGAAAVLAKPFSIRELQQLVTSLV